jgi:2-oxoisovalerate dehydrogenase E1 component
VRLAREEQRVVAFLEPIALYPMRDLYEEKDGAWMTTYPERGRTIRLGEVGVHGEGVDLAIVSFANGFYLAQQAARRLERSGHRVRVIDMRWLSPLPEESLIAAVRGVERVLIVDETRRSCSIADALMALFAESASNRLARVTATDSFIATGPAYAATMPSVEQIVEAAERMMDRVQ